MNVPNIISLSRVPVLFAIILFFYIPWKWANSLAFALFVAGALTDWLDGYLARKYNKISDFGKLMDALTDKIFVVGLFVALLVFGMLPHPFIFFVLLILAREFLITGLRLVAASKGLVIASEGPGKRKALTQFLGIGILMAAQVLRVDLVNFSPLWVVDGMRIVGLAVFLLSTYFTVQSGVYYLIKYWKLYGKETG